MDFRDSSEGIGRWAENGKPTPTEFVKFPAAWKVQGPQAIGKTDTAHQ
jgi:hypothetical protein